MKYGLSETVTFEERVKTGLDVDPVVISNERIEELGEQADRALRKEVMKGDLTSMATRWRKRAMTTGAEIVPLAQEITVDDLRQHQVVILRRLRNGPLTEFELTAEVAEYSGYTADEAASRMAVWLEELQGRGFVWMGRLYNRRGQWISASALTGIGRRLVG